MTEPDEVTSSPGAPVAGRLRRIWQRIRGAAAHILFDDTGALNDEAMPSGYAAPYRRGSRQVRNLWHIPF
jgi:hypothetical protein